jgi:hypothetical protein
MDRENYHDPERIYDLEVAIGTAMSCTLTAEGTAYWPVDYKIVSMEESYPDDMRLSVIESCPREGELDGKLREEIFVLFGPMVSAKRAVILLKGLARRIEKKGLVIGRGEDGEVVSESVDGDRS